ncbi:hypothetical protein L0668_12550 [Paraglaciecola aquimarina]|uniref:Lipoprotein n=1 Tax=Paraglaciecola algarum TaxID=3050085 RepID=A0ABS9D7L2_9ALTE|nr:hypothetical protein [Paraglaciecola sp. G1-23]MCF2948943.1 hypothetical protein [Paraglaciecola sp. G1-23]
MYFLTKISIFTIISSVLIACGGSSNSPTSVVPPPVKAAPPIQAKRSINGLHFYYQDTFYQGQAASIAVTSDTSDLVNIEWQQISGSPLTILATHTQVIGFDIKQSGDYQIEFHGTNSQGQTINEIFSFSALVSSNNRTNIRLDHAVSEQAAVSFRALANPNKTMQSIRWEQLDGPTIDDLQSQDEDVFFTAPQVIKDEIVQIEAQITYTDGSSETDNSLLVVKNVQVNTNGYFPRYAEKVVTTDVYPFIQEGPHANNLRACVYNNQVAKSCEFSLLPLIGQEHSTPTIQHILERLVVSHDWMGLRFKQYLEQSSTSEDMLKLLRATTAIVISYDVRPSFYWTATGAIYLDAANFWMTPEERDTLNTQPDYRSDFGDDLQFFIPWRYVKDNDYYFRNSDYPAHLRLSKTFSDLEANISWLMYHELAHANDFFPPNSWSNMPEDISPLDYSNQNDASSVLFEQTFGLTSDTMKSVAKVSFAGETANTEQKNLSAQDIVSHFEPDSAPAYYSYSTVREDYATLFERFMMSYRLDVSADVAVISNINNDNLIVSWGQRDRFNESKVQPRVQNVVQNILPNLDVRTIQQNLPTPILMRENQDWFVNLQLGNVPPTPRNKQGEKTLRPVSPKDYWHTYRHGPKGP